MTIRALSCLTLLGLLCLTSTVAVVAAEPPTPKSVFYGMKEWKSTGSYPKEFILPIWNLGDPRSEREPYIHQYMVLATSLHPGDPRQPNTVEFELNREPANKSNPNELSKDHLIIRLNDPPNPEISSLLWDGHGEIFELNTGDIFPYGGQLLGVTKIEHHQLVLSVIDRKRVPDSVWPQDRSRTLSMNQPEGAVVFFGNRPAAVAGKPPDPTFGRIRIEKIDSKRGRAKVAVAPMKNFRLSIDDVEQTIQSVSKGDVLRAGGMNYRVVNVVAPQELKDVGRLVGWIELDPEPVANP